ncbi:YkgJ family cysteine cluster protein [Pseudomonas aeruginosa]|uniref:YkgJ family cysteine cluster protein n=1 Tax=Pseudomonas aeruginosa TaxID=287 RepID=UPI0039BCD794|nr:YkgJ family cysteine cluster protein [Pseudomonas aeruginosa]
MGLKEDQESALATCSRLVEGLPAKLVKKEFSIANRLERAKLSPLKKLEAIYELLGEIGAYVAPSTPCRKGCSSCCHFAVTVSEIEVQYIEAHTKYKRLKQALPAEDFHGQACPFLRHNSCSIYSARPFVCRRQHSLAPSPEWCAPEKSFAGEFPQLKSSELETAFDALRVSSPVWDIRQVFGWQ